MCYSSSNFQVLTQSIFMVFMVLSAKSDLGGRPPTQTASFVHKSKIISKSLLNSRPVYVVPDRSSPTSTLPAGSPFK